MKSLSTSTLPVAARKTLVKLGADITVARKKRRISTLSMAERAFLSRSTLARIEKGDPSVSMGAYLSVLAILGLAKHLEQVADRTNDTLGLDLDEDRLPKRIRSGRRTRARSMNDVIQVHVEFYGKTHHVGYFRYHSNGHRPSSLFEYTDSWLSHREAFALDPANLQLTTGQHYLTSEKTALPGAIRDCAPDRWGRQLIRRAFQKMGHNRSLSELDYLLAINDYYQSWCSSLYARW